MPTVSSTELHRGGGLGVNLPALVEAEGSGRHPWRRDPALHAGPDSIRDLADAVHHLALIHGPHPGLVDFAGDRAALGAARDRMLAAFAVERGYLMRLIVAAGPLPSTPGQALAQAVVIAQRHAIETLGRSDRTGCSLGAAAALLLDWAAMRPVLDAAAARFGMDSAPAMLQDAIRAAVAEASLDPAAARAVDFGARQLLLQHRGLWDLLETRAQARHAA